MENINYLAGYIDGDGCFYITKTTDKFRATLIVSSTYIPVLEHFKSQFGGDIYPVITKKETWKQQFHWRLYMKESLEMAKKVIPYLTEKRTQAFKFCNFIQNPTHKVRFNMIEEIRNDRKGDITSITIEEIRKLPIIGFQKDFEYAYLAGFIDAECSFSINKYKPKKAPNPVYKIVLECNNTSKEIFFWLHQRLGGSLTFINRNFINPNHSNQINWKISGKKLSYLLPFIQPYLIQKKPHCELLMKFYKTTIPNGVSRKTESFKKSYASTLVLRDTFVSQLHSLNQKGSNIV